MSEWMADADGLLLMEDGRGAREKKGGKRWGTSAAEKKILRKCIMKRAARTREARPQLLVF
jgi:hypothetical protein